MATVVEVFAAAVGHHQGGRLQEADQLYQQVLAADPGDAGAWHLRGVLASQIGQNAIAIRSIERALTLHPSYFEAYNNLGLIYQKESRWGEAAACFRRAIGFNPGFAEAYANLGNVLMPAGHVREAVESYRRAVELLPDSAEAHFNLGLGLQTLGQADEAARSYRRAIELQPGHAKGHNNLGLLLMEQRQLVEAERCFQCAIQQRADFPEVHNNLGTVLVSQGRLDEALAAFDRAMALRPEYAEAQAGRGNVFKEKGKLDAAVDCYQRAVRLNPGLANAHCNLGYVLKEQVQLAEAADSFRQALACDAAHAVASFGLGHTLLLQRREQDAAAWFRKAIQLKPDYAAAYVNLAAALHGERNWPQIAAYCRKAIELQPDCAEAHLNLAIALFREGKLDEAMASCDRALAFAPQSAEGYSARGVILKGMARLEESAAAYRRAIEVKPDFAEAHSALVYGLYFCPALDSAAIGEEHRRWNERHGVPLAKFIRPSGNEPAAERRLRIGYVSAEFRDHCQSFFTMPLLKHQDHERFEVFCYSNTARPDHVTDQLRPLADHWREIGEMTVEEIADVVRQDQIDILVDLMMHMDRGAPLLFARKPAPVQVAWLAYPGTTGLTAMDYRISDPWLDPVGMFEQFYSEETVRLPHSFWCYDPLAEELEVGPLPAREKGYVTFGCLNNFCKVNEGVLRLWGRVMRETAENGGGVVGTAHPTASRLILLAPEGSAREQVLTVLREEGIAAERVTFVSFQPRADYLATYRQIDIGLETLPYNGHTTSLDSFWLGVPVPTIVGQTVVGRAGVSLLQNLELPELIAQTPDEYVRVVSELAGDIDRLAALRAGLRQRMERSPLMNGKQFAREMEAAYRGMWRRWCEGKDVGSEVGG